MKRTRIRRAACFGGVLLLALFVAALVSTDRFRAFGAAPSPSTQARMRASPRFAGDHFVNVEPTTLMKVSTWETTKHWLSSKEMRAPSCPLPVVDPRAALASPPPGGLRVTWLGHSTALIEIDGAVVLTDPIWSERASPSRWVGPKRFHPPPLAIGELPKLDAVVISHEHYDHLDMATIRALGSLGTTFFVPLGIAAHLEAWGIPAARIHEQDWWESAPAGPLTIVSTPARHFAGRGVPGRGMTSWTSWTIVSRAHRVFFSGDTGLSEGFREIGERYGPFDVALLEIGQHHPDWGDIHLGAEGAVLAVPMLRARALLPIHWATFELAYHAWSEPAETTYTLGQAHGFRVLSPRLGEPVEPTSETSPWWRALPPIVGSCP